MYSLPAPTAFLLPQAGEGGPAVLGRMRVHGQQDVLLIGRMIKMFQLQEILAPERVCLNVIANSKKKAFERISQIIAVSIPSLNAHDIFDGLIARERLGSTAVDHGVAIPHCRLPIENPIGCFLLLKEPIDFNSPITSAVQMLFALLVPEEADETHLELLATIAQLFRQEKVRAQLQSAKTSEELYQRLINAYSYA